jgi:hypothetical protein
MRPAAVFDAATISNRGEDTHFGFGATEPTSGSLRTSMISQAQNLAVKGWCQQENAKLRFLKLRLPNFRLLLLSHTCTYGSYSEKTAGISNRQKTAEMTQLLYFENCTRSSFCGCDQPTLAISTASLSH